MKQLIECVPNFSEGRDMGIIKQITDVIEAVEGIRLLDVDPGKATNRTVVTFVGEPEPVIEAAFQAMKKAKELIDMSKHTGEHPRFGATDVCPLVPVSGITLEETVPYALRLAKRAGEELDYPIYCYEAACQVPERKNLAYVRAGEYEALAEKLKDAKHKPDFGPAEFRPRTGTTAVGARDFLIAYNVNLNTTSTRRANAIAFDLREAGRIKREGDPVSGTPILDEKGEQIRIPGLLKGVKAIGWYIEEYGIAQISMNITNIAQTTVHKAFEEARNSANSRGIRVTGSELVGMVPLRVLLDAGRYFLEKQERSVGVSEAELVKIAVKSLGLDDLRPFDPSKKVIEYMLRSDKDAPLLNMSLKAFADETAAESPAPGGGSIAAYVGALGASLATMVANLSSHKRGWDHRWKEFSDAAAEGQIIKDKLLGMVDEDTKAFNAIMAAFGLPKDSEADKNTRKQAIQEATRNAIEVPLKVMELCYNSLSLIERMATEGNPNSVSDAGVAALCARAAVRGAGLNVKINAAGYKDPGYVSSVLMMAHDWEKAAKKKEKEILEIVNGKIGE